MKKICAFLLYVVARFALSLRYRITVSGLEELRKTPFPKKGGALFLANHPAEIDPCILVTFFWRQFHVHPLAIDYLFQKPFIRGLLEFVGALPVPNFEASSNTFKQLQIEKTYARVYALLRNRGNLLIYPAGGLKRGASEVIGGASGVHTILQEEPDTNVVLIRTEGLWGSSFSRALTHKSPDILEALGHGLKVLLKNGLFFAPRRHVRITCTVAPADFPWGQDRLTLNRYLEEWFNANGSEPLSLVSYSRWREELPQVEEQAEAEAVSIAGVDSAIKSQVVEEIGRLVGDKKVEEDHELQTDLGLDSLDQAQLVAFLKDQFGVMNVHGAELKTVSDVIAFAARLKKGAQEEEELSVEEQKIEVDEGRPLAFSPIGESTIEAFLHACDKMGKHVACADAISGEVTYRKLKLGVLLLADKIRKMPGKHIGIMLPASVAVNVLILATQLAGKVPVMINWTLGSRNLNSVVKQSGITQVISSWNFLNKLDNIDLGGVDDKIVLIEEMRRSIGLFDKGRALLRLSAKPSKLLAGLDKSAPAVILFTSGTEREPKGVPLSHANILANQRSAYDVVDVQPNDVLLGTLPPFHSFGFSVTGLFPLLSGLRVAFSPNPTDGRRLAQAIHQWGVTLSCLAPSFLKNLLRVGKPEQLKTLRLVVVGAEKAPPELYEKMTSLNPKARLVEGYGITECAPILTINPIKETHRQGVGLPLPCVDIRIVHPETHAPIPTGTEGRILASGPNVFSGYLDPNLPSPFIQLEGKQWYDTGDLGYLDDAGFLTLSGRLKRFVKIGGEMISLTAIEETLVQGATALGWTLDPERPSLAVCAQESGDKKSTIHLFTTFPTSTEAVNAHLRAAGMSNLVRITSAIQVPYIPVLGSGKIDYRTLSKKLS